MGGGADQPETFKDGLGPINHGLFCKVSAQNSLLLWSN